MSNVKVALVTPLISEMITKQGIDAALSEENLSASLTDADIRDLIGLANILKLDAYECVSYALVTRGELDKHVLRESVDNNPISIEDLAKMTPYVGNGDVDDIPLIQRTDKYLVINPIKSILDRVSTGDIQTGIAEALVADHFDVTVYNDQYDDIIEVYLGDLLN